MIFRNFFLLFTAFGRSSGGNHPELAASGPGFKDYYAMLDRSFILATSAIHLITVVPCVRPYLGKSDIKLSHPPLS